MRSRSSLIGVVGGLWLLGGARPAVADVPTVGTLKVLVALATTGDEPYDLADAYDTVFRSSCSLPQSGCPDGFPSLKDFLLAASRGKLTITGEVAASSQSSSGWYVLPTLTKDNYQTVINDALRADGYDLTQFNTIIYDWPQYPSSSRHGSPGWALASVGLMNRTLTHEFGHNLGLLEHSNALYCLEGPLGRHCVSAEYEFIFETMGNHHGGIYHAHNGEKLGWVSVAGGEGAEVRADGTFNLGSFESASGLRYLKIADQTAGSGELYYVEVRERLGYGDEPLAKPALLIYWVDTVREEPPGTGTNYRFLWSSNFIDTARQWPDSTPDNPFQSVAFFKLEWLGESQTFVDSTRGIAITNLGSVDPQRPSLGLRVNVDLRTPSPDTPPTLDVLLEAANGSLQAIQDGLVLTGTVRLWIDVADDRGVQTLNIQGLSSEWISAPVNPHQFKVFTLKMSDRPDGTYPVTFKAMDTRGQVTARTINMVVDHNDHSPPTAAITAPLARAILPKFTSGWQTLRMDVTDNSLDEGWGSVQAGFLARSFNTNQHFVLGYETSEGFGFSVTFNVLTGTVFEVEADHNGLGLTGLQSRTGGLPTGEYELRGYARDLNFNVGWSAPIRIGVWRNVGQPQVPGPGEFQRAEVNGDRVVDLSDAIGLLNYLFSGGVNIRTSCLDASDVNDDGDVDISDPVAILLYLFSGGLVPPTPFLVVGKDPTPEFPDLLGPCN